MIRFKALKNETPRRDRLAIQFEESITPRLRGLILAVAGFIENRFGLDITITSLIREDGGVHQYGRGADIRTKSRDHVDIFTDYEIDEIVQFINREFPYKYKRRYDLKFSCPLGMACSA